MRNKALKSCRICHSKNLLKYLDLGKHPFSNSFINKNQIKLEKKFPLELVFCKTCYLSQLSIIPDTKFIFDKYDYLSSSSRALSNHYKKLIKNVTKKEKLKRNDTVIDIGCNDGILLNHYPNHMKNIIGIEPSNAINHINKKKIIPLKQFFNFKNSIKYLKKFDKPKIITITNVLAQIDDLNDFVKGLENILRDDGIIIIEFPYLKDMIDKGFFDLIYHEHLSYFSLNPVKYILEKYNLKLFDFQKVEIGASGPALRIFICKKSYSKTTSKKLKKQLQKEINWGLSRVSKYKTFSKKTDKIIQSLRKIIIKKHNQGYHLGCYTASAKGNTMLNCLKISKKIFKFTSENNKKKINKYTPGTHLKIIDDNKFLEKKIDYALLLSWNYAKFFLKNSQFKKRGGKFIIPFPKLIIK